MSEEVDIDVNEPMLLNFFNDLKEEIQPLSLESIVAIEELIEDGSLEDGNSNFKGMIFIKIYPEGDIKIIHKNKMITSYDKKMLSDWIISMNHKKYADDFFRIDFENYIYIFKIYQFNRNIVFVGHILDNNPMAKIELLDLRQNILSLKLKEQNSGQGTNDDQRT